METPRIDDDTSQVQALSLSDMSLSLFSEQSMQCASFWNPRNLNETHTFARMAVGKITELATRKTATGETWHGFSQNFGPFRKIILGGHGGQDSNASTTVRSKTASHRVGLVCDVSLFCWVHKRSFCFIFYYYFGHQSTFGCNVARYTLSASIGHGPTIHLHTLLCAWSGNLTPPSPLGLPTHQEVGEKKVSRTSCSVFV